MELVVPKDSCDTNMTMPIIIKMNKSYRNKNIVSKLSKVSYKSPNISSRKRRSVSEEDILPDLKKLKITEDKKNSIEQSETICFRPSINKKEEIKEKIITIEKKLNLLKTSAIKFIDHLESELKELKTLC